MKIVYLLTVANNYTPILYLWPIFVDCHFQGHIFTDWAWEPIKCLPEHYCDRLQESIQLKYGECTKSNSFSYRFLSQDSGYKWTAPTLTQIMMLKCPCTQRLKCYFKTWPQSSVNLEYHLYHIIIITKYREGCWQSNVQWNCSKPTTHESELNWTIFGISKIQNRYSKFYFSYIKY